MQVLILGSTGMLGHKLMQVLGHEFRITGTVRGDASELRDHPFFSGMDIVGNINTGDLGGIRTLLEDLEPDIAINCIGIVKQLPAAHDPLQSIAVNALFPHQLAHLCRENGTRLIHMSTDCVFSGIKGCYSEDDPSDAEDLYGKTKFLGEVDYPGCLTIRTSIIGRELGTSHGLVEWFLGQDGKTVPGYTKAIFSGLTTTALSEIIGTLISGYPGLHGVRQVASEPISKFDLLCLIRRVYGLAVTIEPEYAVVNDRSLNPARFMRETSIKVPSWEYMIHQMYQDETPYDTIREIYARR